MCVRFNLGQRLRLTFPSRLRVTRAAEAGGDGKGKGRKTLSLSLSPFPPFHHTPRATKERQRETNRDESGPASQTLSQPFSEVCQAAPVSLFWAYNGLNELPERFEFSFNLIGKWKMAF